MKKIIPSYFSVALISLGISMVSCQKEISMPNPQTGQSYHPEITGVNHGRWFSAAAWNTIKDGSGFQMLAFDKSVPELSSNILDNGKILVFGVADDAPHNVQALPSYFGAYVIGVSKQVESLEFTAIRMNTLQASSSVSFTYILIPKDKLVAGDILDYRNYNDVCAYYHIPQ